MKESIALIAEVIRSPTMAWRVAIAAGITAHVAWACGWLPGISGFALAADVEEQQQEIVIRLARVEESQRALLRMALAQEICRLLRLRNDSTALDARRQFQQSLVEKQDEYVALTGGRYPLSECET